MGGLEVLLSRCSQLTSDILDLASPKILRQNLSEPSQTVAGTCVCVCVCVPLKVFDCLAPVTNIIQTRGEEKERSAGFHRGFRCIRFIPAEGGGNILRPSPENLSASWQMRKRESLLAGRRAKASDGGNLISTALRGRTLAPVSDPPR